MTKITQNSILTSFTATNRFILRKCNPKLLNVNNASMKTVFDSSFETSLKEHSAINYKYNPSKPNVKHSNTSSCVTSQLSDISTYNSGSSTWDLKGNQTVTGCLTIPTGTTLVIGSGLGLANNGTIINNGTITNNGNINNAGGTITNSGTINNATYNSNIYNYSNGTITNNAGGIINNINRSGIYTYLGGTIINIPGGTINNSGGGITIPPKEESSCGVGTITGDISGNQPILFCIPDLPILVSPLSLF